MNRTDLAVIRPDIEDAGHTIILRPTGDATTVLNLAAMNPRIIEAHLDLVMFHEILHVLLPELTEDEVLRAERVSA